MGWEAISAIIAGGGLLMTTFISAMRNKYHQGRLDESTVKKDDCNQRHEKIQESLAEGMTCMVKLSGKIDTISALTDRQEKVLDRFEDILRKNGG